MSEEKRKWWLLSAVSCILGIVLLDETVVGIALPTIQKDLALSGNEGHWVVNAYLLSFACFVAVGGKLGDHFGTLRAFLTGLSLFAVCSLACGLALSGDMLIAARAVQGLGAAVIFPLYIAMITMTFPKEQRGKALAFSGAIGTTFLALGPLVGGLFTDLLSWRWIFWINPFISLGVGLIVSMTWRDVKRPAGSRIDWLGLILIASGLFCIVLALMETESWGWFSMPTLAFLIIGGVLLFLFWQVEDGKQNPLIEVDLFSKPIFAGSNWTVFMAQYAKMPLFVFVALYAQTNLKLDPIAAGVLVMLAPLLQPFTAWVCGRVTGKISQRKQVAFGMFMLCACLTWLCLSAYFEANVYLFASGLLLAGFSFPFLFVPGRAAIMAALPEHKHGQGGGIAMSSQMIGGTVGLAVSSAIYALGGYVFVFGFTALLLAISFFLVLAAFRGA